MGEWEIVGIESGNEKNAPCRMVPLCTGYLMQCRQASQYYKPLVQIDGTFICGISDAMSTGIPILQATGTNRRYLYVREIYALIFDGYGTR